MSNEMKREFYELPQKAGLFGGPFLLQKGVQVGL